MSLDELDDDVMAAYSDLGDEPTVALDRETKNELAMLQAALGADEGELLRRGIHALFQQVVGSGDLDFHLRSGYDVTYDEYLAGATYEEMTGGSQYPDRDDERRYQM
ncbi:MAG: hypothetical protein V5A38_02410 [Halolamina sp.]|uniref:hypothetical protein n=1 Tax=Halolamina sp. TaxID=1940283 RepID=UPI002FC30516